MTIEIIKGQDNAVAAFFSAATQTPETDACWDKYLRYPYSDIGTGDIRILAQRLERERDEAKQQLRIAVGLLSTQPQFADKHPEDVLAFVKEGAK
jgi:hypothetical protein